MQVNAQQILKALWLKHTQRRRPDRFFTEVLNGPFGSNRFDAVAIKPSWTRPEITGYEVKVDRQDFLADYKWPAYLEPRGDPEKRRDMRRFTHGKKQRRETKKSPGLWLV